MKAIKVDLPSELKLVEVHTFADFHIGDRHCDMGRVQEMVNRVRDTDNAYCILNGDICNNATKTSVSDSYAEDIPPMEQLEMFDTLFYPVREKILAITSGNHENRTYNKEGIDITAVAAKQLGVLDRYAKTGAVVFLRFGDLGGHHHNRKVVYSIHCNHGSGGGRKEGAKAIRLADMASVVDADIYIHSHTHLPMVMKQGFFRADHCSGVVYPVTKLFVNTSAQLDYGGYGEAFEFKPSSKDTPIIYLDGTQKRMWAEL